MEPIRTRPPLQLGENQKLFAVNADYRESGKGRSWYYVRAKTKREAKAIFKSYITWLSIYKVEEVTDPFLVRKILSSQCGYICF